MKFGLFYENQVHRLWGEKNHLKVYLGPFDEIELADDLGYDHARVVEYQFLEKCSHSSVPAEVAQ
jgi:hypothetical protein